MKLKSIVIALALTGVSFVAHAKESVQDLQRKFDESVIIACEEARNLGEDTMRLRQTPITEQEHVDIIRQFEIEDSRLEAMVIDMVRKAHKVPLANPENIQKAVTSFGNDVRDLCRKNKAAILI